MGLVNSRIRGTLRIVLAQNGRANLGAIEGERNSRGIDAALLALLEDHLYNGWGRPVWAMATRPDSVSTLTCPSCPGSLTMRFACLSLAASMVLFERFLALPEADSGLSLFLRQPHYYRTSVQGVRHPNINKTPGSGQIYFGGDTSPAIISIPMALWAIEGFPGE